MSKRPLLQGSRRDVDVTGKTKSIRGNGGAVGASAAGAAGSISGSAIASVVAVIVAIVTVCVLGPIVADQAGRIRDLENAPPVEGGNQTALDLLQDQIDDLNNVTSTQQETIDMQQMEIDSITQSLMDAQQMISEIFFLIAGQMWTSELKMGPFDPPEADQLFTTQGLPPSGGDDRGNWRMTDFYGAAPMWNVSVTVPFVTMDIINAPNYFSAVQSNGIFLENGTYSVSIEIEGECVHPAGRGSCNHIRWLTVIPLSAMTSLDGLDATVDFAGNAMAQDDFTITYLWNLRVAQISTGSSTSTTPATVPTNSAMSNGILNIPPEGAHVHMVHFLPYLTFWDQRYTVFKVSIAKFETALP